MSGTFGPRSGNFAHVGGLKLGGAGGLLGLSAKYGSVSNFQFKVIRREPEKNLREIGAISGQFNFAVQESSLHRTPEFKRDKPFSLQ